MVKSQYQQDLHYSSSQSQIKTKLLHNFAGTSCNILLFQWISYFKTHLHLAHVTQYPWANGPEYNKRSANLQQYQQLCYSFSRILSYCGSFLWKWMKNNPFLDTSFLFLTKISASLSGESSTDGEGIEQYKWSNASVCVEWLWFVSFRWPPSWPWPSWFQGFFWSFHCLCASWAFDPLNNFKQSIS